MSFRSPRRTTDDRDLPAHWKVARGQPRLHLAAVPAPLDRCCCRSRPGPRSASGMLREFSTDLAIRQLPAHLGKEEEYGQHEAVPRMQRDRHLRVGGPGAWNHRSAASAMARRWFPRRGWTSRAAFAGPASGWLRRPRPTLSAMAPVGDAEGPSPAGVYARIGHRIRPCRGRGLRGLPGSSCSGGGISPVRSPMPRAAASW